MPSQLQTLPHSTHCLCASCSATTAETYTETYKLECLARAFGHFKAEQKEKYLRTLKTQKDWEQRLTAIETLIEKLRIEGRYETAYWKDKSIGAGTP